MRKLRSLRRSRKDGLAVRSMFVNGALGAVGLVWRRAVVCNVALLRPRTRENVATLLRSGQNFGLSALFVIGGFVEEQYKGNIHKFSHQMDTQEGTSHLAMLYFETLESFLKHLPAQTTLVVVETLQEAKDLRRYVHPLNATYLFGPEIAGLTKLDLTTIEAFFQDLHREIPPAYHAAQKKTAHLDYLKIATPGSLNLGVCGSIVLYDRHSKLGSPLVVVQEP